MEQNCIFCKIYKGEIPSDILYRDEDCFVIRDIVPKALVHLLILPTRHFTYLSNMTSDDEGMVGHLFMVARDMAKKEDLTESGYRLIINQGPDSGQVVPHLHLHLLGGHALGALG